MSWASQAPAFLAVLTLVLLPGLLVGAAAGLRGVPLLSSAPLLSYGALTAAILLATRLHLTWGALPIVLATVLLTLVAAAVTIGVRMARGDRTAPWRREGWWRPQDRAALGDFGVLVAAVAVAALTAVLVIIKAVGPPDSVQQTWDSPFHLNGIDRVHELGSAAPGTVAKTANLFGSGSFYPPLFHAVASMVVGLTSGSVPAAANVTALALASVVWPLSALGLVWAVLPRRTALVAGAAATTVIGVFPAHLMAFGVLWPNLMGLAALPAAIALLASLLAPVGRAPSVASALVGGGVGALGLYYAHPGTIFAGIAIGLPLLVVGIVRLARWTGGHAARQAGRAVAGWLAAVAVLLFFVWLGARLWGAIDTMKQLDMLRAQNWEAVETYAQAIGEGLTLSLIALHPLVVVGVAVCIGAAVVWRDRRVWLVAAHAITIYLYSVAAATDESVAETLTGFWYNDRHRIMASLAVTALPLVAVGLTFVADRLRGALRPAVARLRDVSPRTPWLPGALSLGLVLAFVSWATPLSAAWGSIQNDIRTGYQGERGRVLTTPAEVSLYEGLAQEPDPGAAVTGSPLNGSVFAGVLSDRPWIFGHLRNSLDDEQTLVASHFKEFTTDPAVCRAVKKFKIGYVVEDTSPGMPTSPAQTKLYSGLTGLAGTPGLTPVAHEGTVTAYRVGSCTG